MYKVRHGRLLIFLRPVHLPMHTKSNILLWKKVFAVSSFDTLKTKNIDGRWLVFINVFNRPGQNLIAIVELCIVVIHIVRYSRDNTISTVHRQPKIQRFKKRERKSFNNSGDVFLHCFWYIFSPSSLLNVTPLKLKKDRKLY